jgi:hypothetical protein
MMEMPRRPAFCISTARRYLYAADGWLSYWSPYDTECTSGTSGSVRGAKNVRGLLICKGRSRARSFVWCSEQQLYV